MFQLPNTLGFLLGLTQIILYMIYKEGNKTIAETNERSSQQEVSLDMKKMTPIHSAELYPTSPHQPQVTEVDIFPTGKPAEPDNNV